MQLACIRNVCDEFLICEILTANGPNMKQYIFENSCEID